MYGPIAKLISKRERRAYIRRLGSVADKYHMVGLLPPSQLDQSVVLRMHSAVTRAELLADAWKALPWYRRMWLTVTGQDRHWFDR